ncbi:ROK family protein [Microbacterium telephonicum]|uniref:Putative NBD/HSP70 family sugar kinase n=1 Tax=Microbacterium telephonicum TaxID=1714841 RepID=A0A498CAF1_9MICO|nr:ROK family protein [Microbacterium telephonicum]RLK52672.1 putative NBD/HSP70 family sugar kinase [Microbacterium telephonicum]
MEDSVRQRNLARLVRSVHLGGPRSRSALTEETGLNRSTIADLVTELVDTGIVREEAPTSANSERRVGRPSPIVSAHPGVVAIAANPEVDAVEIAAVGLDRRIVVRERHEQSGLISPEATARLIADRVAAWRQDVLADARIVGVGLAVPGLVRAADGLVRRAPHLDWTDAPLRDLVSDAVHLPVAIDNDASLGALAEHLFGAAHGIEDVVYLNGGASGIGGGVIVHGIPVTGARGYAGEFGQNRPGIADGADRRDADGVLEDEVSRARLLAVLRLPGADDAGLRAALTASDDPAVVAELSRQRRILATALANAVNVLNPEVIVLGGFLAMIAEFSGSDLVDTVRAQAMSANGEGLRILSAALAGDRLLIGAAEAAFAPLLRDPVG